MFFYLSLYSLCVNGECFVGCYFFFFFLIVCLLKTTFREEVDLNDS